MFFSSSTIRTRFFMGRLLVSLLCGGASYRPSRYFVLRTAATVFFRRRSRRGDLPGQDGEGVVLRFQELILVRMTGAFAEPAGSDTYAALRCKSRESCKYTRGRSARPGRPPPRLSSRRGSQTVIFAVFQLSGRKLGEHPLEGIAELPHHSDAAVIVQGQDGLRRRGALPLPGRRSARWAVRPGPGRRATTCPLNLISDETVSNSSIYSLLFGESSRNDPVNRSSVPQKPALCHPGSTSATPICPKEPQTLPLSKGEMARYNGTCTVHFMLWE